MFPLRRTVHNKKRRKLTSAGHPFEFKPAFSISSVPVFFQYRDGRLEGKLQIPRALCKMQIILRRPCLGGVTFKKATVAAGFHASSLGDMTWDERLCSDSVESSRPHVSSQTCQGQISKKLPNGCVGADVFGPFHCHPPSE